MEKVSSHYGLALYSLAVDLDKVSEYQLEVKELSRIFKENVDFIMILGSSFLPLEERQEILRKTLKGVSDNIMAFIMVIMDNNRTNEMLDIFESFNSYCNEYRGVSEGLVYSAFKLEQKVIDQIQAKIEKVEHNKVELKNIVDPSLIGGVKIVIHDHIYDGSIKHHIEVMKSDLLK